MKDLLEELRELCITQELLINAAQGELDIISQQVSLITNTQ